MQKQSFCIKTKLCKNEVMRCKNFVFARTRYKALLCNQLGFGNCFVMHARYARYARTQTEAITKLCFVIALLGNQSFALYSRVNKFGKRAT